MALPAKIVDNNGNTVKVTPRGQLVTAPLEFSVTEPVELAAIDTAYNLAEPIAGKQGVITDIILSANKDVGVDGSLIEIYEADAADSTVVSESILRVSLDRNANIVLSGLNWKYTKAKWLNIKCNDNTIYATVAGYYIDADGDVKTNFEF